MTAAQIIFWLSAWALVHSYVAYPLILQFLLVLRGQKHFSTFSNDDAELPTLSILMAAYNEEKVIEKKIRSVFATNYPGEKIEMLVGSDCSSDGTNMILEQLALEFSQLKFTLFSQRQGKVNIINQLSEKASGEILIITDANVLLEPQTLFETVKYFGDERVGLVDTHMTNYGIVKSGISFQEKSYISREVSVKDLESRAFGSMIGPFGGCFALRKTLFTKVPSTYLVDDFFICMNVLAQKHYAINSLTALVYEDVSNILSVEFRRKIRIAMGNFQNLLHFRKLLWPPFTGLSFSFFSHKVLRWFGPFFLLAALVTNFILFNYSTFYRIALVLQLFVTFLPFADIFLKKFQIHIVLLRFATHFYTMNLSLLIGFIKSLKGVKSNVWKPTERFQGEA
jgi:cellulose synthase/poly-beta-1,6-N-acetylglucosamine synthase-like glycosyltransferase